MTDSPITDEHRPTFLASELIEKLLEVYCSESYDERDDLGRKAAIRDIAVRMGLYNEFCGALSVTVASNTDE